MMDMQRKIVELMVKRFAFLDQMPEIGMAPFQISDYQLSPFDEERLGEYAPEFYLPDWCPPPPAQMEAEMHELLEWVDREWDKGDLYPDPATYPFDDYFDREDLYVCKF